MAYYEKYKRDNKGKRTFAEEAPERRYAKTNRYSDEKPSSFGRTNRSFDERSASFSKQGRFDNKRFDRFDGKNDKGKPGFKNDFRNVKGEKPFDKKKFEEGRPFGRPFKKAPFESNFAKPSFKRTAPVSRMEPQTQDVVQSTPVEQDENLLFGRNPIREALKSGRDIEKMLVSEGDLSGSAREILSMARKANVKIQMVEKSHLDHIVRNHQGMVAYASAYQYAEIDDMLQLADDKGEKPFLIVLDQITDPHNLGAIIRTAACCGAHGVIIPRHRAVGLTSTAVKTSSGAVEYVKVARVTNIAQTLKQLKEKGIWAFAADMAGKDYRQVDFSSGTALVIGSEGDGISSVVRSQCDDTISIPMVGEISSMNASVAAGILMHAVYCARCR